MECKGSKSDENITRFRDKTGTYTIVDFASFDRPLQHLGIKIVRFAVNKLSKAGKGTARGAFSSYPNLLLIGYSIAAILLTRRMFLHTSLITSKIFGKLTKSSVFITCNNLNLNIKKLHTTNK